MATSPSPGWFYELEGKLEGPIPTSQLRQLVRAGTLKPTDRVKREGMDKFLLAKNIKGLFDVPAATAVPTATAVEEGEIPEAAPADTSSFDFYGSSPPSAVAGPASSKPGKAKPAATPAAPIEVPASAFDFYSDASPPPPPAVKEPAKPAAKEPAKPAAKPTGKPAAKSPPTATTDDDPMAAFAVQASGGGGSPFDFDTTAPPPPAKGAKPAAKEPAKPGSKDGEKPKDGEKAEVTEPLTILDGEITLAEGTPAPVANFFGTAPPTAAAFAFDEAGNMVAQPEGFVAPTAPLNVPGGVYAQFTGVAVEFVGEAGVRVHVDGQTTLSVGQRWLTARTDIAGVPTQTVCVRLSAVTAVRIEVHSEVGTRGKAAPGQLVLSVEAGPVRVGAACGFAPDVAQGFVEQLLAVAT
jgi:hypothetical protein